MRSPAGGAADGGRRRPLRAGFLELGVVLADHGTPAAVVAGAADAAEEEYDQEHEKKDCQHGSSVPVARRIEPPGEGRTGP